MTLATLQNLRTFTFNNHPTDLEEGQLAFNLAAENQNLGNKDANIYMYVGNGSNIRMDEGGEVLVPTGTAGKGWIRYRLRNVSVEGDDIYGDLSIINSRLKIARTGTNHAEILLPTQVVTPGSGTESGSLRWNTTTSKLEAWNGTKWDTTAKVTVSDIAPANPSHGDMWLDPTSSGSFYIYVVPSSGPAYWAQPVSGPETSALQPGNGVSSNSLNQIDIINQGTY